MEERNKIVFLCHFSNSEIRSALHVEDNSIVNYIRKKTGHELKDYAPWVTEFIKEFEKFKDLDIHIVAPHPGLKKEIVEVELNGINYHLFKPLKHWVGRKIDSFLKKEEDFHLSRRRAKTIIDNINPDLVCLCGAENPYYSICALDVENRPLMVLLQTVLNNPKLKAYNKGYIKRAAIEKEIFLKAQYFGTEDRLYYDILKQINPEAVAFKTTFAWHKPPKMTVEAKEFDFAFMAHRLVKYKGIEHLIDAFGLVLKENPDAMLNIVGSCEAPYMEYLRKKVEDNNAVNNVVFSGYYPEHDDALYQVMKSSCVVLPGITATICSTMLEALFMGLPLICFKTTGTPYFNSERECVLLAENGDINDLAKKMIFALNNKEKMQELANNGKWFANKKFSNEVSGKLLTDAFKLAIDNYYNGKAIPQEALFDINEFPLYE